MTPPPNTSHGGARTGSGRKPGFGAYGGESTKPIRVPESQVETVVAFLEAYRQPTVVEDPRPVSVHSTIRLTSFASRIPCGFPSPAQDYLDESVDLNAALVVQGHEAATFVLRVKGASMSPSIADGDRVVVDRALTAQHGDVVIAVLNDDLTCKRLWKEQGQTALVADNTTFKPIVMTEGDELEIWGVVTHCLRSFRRGGR